MVSWLLLHCKCLFLFFSFLFNQNDNCVVVVVVKNGPKTNNRFRVFKVDQNQKSIPKLVVTFIRIILNSAVFNKYFTILYLYLYSFFVLNFHNFFRVSCAIFCWINFVRVLIIYRYHHYHCNHQLS